MPSTRPGRLRLVDARNEEEEEEAFMTNSRPPVRQSSTRLQKEKKNHATNLSPPHTHTKTSKGMAAAAEEKFRQLLLQTFPIGGCSSRSVSDSFSRPLESQNFRSIIVCPLLVSITGGRRSKTALKAGKRAREPERHDDCFFFFLHDPEVKAMSSSLTELRQSVMKQNQPGLICGSLLPAQKQARRTVAAQEFAFFIYEQKFRLITAPSLGKEAGDERQRRKWADRSRGGAANAPLPAVREENVIRYG